MKHPIAPSAHESETTARRSLPTMARVVLIALLAAPWIAGLPSAHADCGCSVSRPDGHAPIGVMGDHVHTEGEMMLSYRTMHMRMGGNRDGTSSVSNGEVLADFMVAPTDMDMQMHMLGVMYAASADLTLVVMGSILDKSMGHVTRAGTHFRTHSVGIGDTSVRALYRLWQSDGHELHFNAGLSLPTGSIDAKDDTPMGPDSKLPYPMQLGSGTFDLLPGLTYHGQTPDWSWGVQASGIVRLGENSDDYTLGNEADLTVWGARRWADWLSTSLRLDGKLWKDIDGADEDLPQPGAGVVPTAEPDLRGAERIDALLGLNLYGRRGALKAHRLAVEVGLPVYQNLDGPQLETDWLLTLGWQFSR